MRRKDREMSPEFGLEVIRDAPFGVLALEDPGQPGIPYTLPLSLALLDGRLYFHSAKAGRKIELLVPGKKGSLTFVSYTKVPELFTDEALEAEMAAGRLETLLSKVFTTEYASARVTGTLREVRADEEPALYREAFRAICAKYTPARGAYVELAIDAGMSRAAIYEFTIESITAKRKRFAADGHELKWQEAP